MLEIADGQAPVKRSVISERQVIPMPFLTQVMLALVNSGLVRSSRGPDGGYELARSPESISLLDIVTKLQGPVMPKGCLDAGESELCRTGGPQCRLRDVWSDLKQANERVLEDVSLKDLAIEPGGSDETSLPR